ncbi:hypothetical protein K474DRAFT_1676523 [Panus rudis PR-1116 ss-1]|nr:hypothetical protein K474DRAFT_1676523 [Panus rudis PR-1116 ss-1]
MKSGASHLYHLTTLGKLAWSLLFPVDEVHTPDIKGIAYLSAETSMALRKDTMVCKYSKQTIVAIPQRRPVTWTQFVSGCWLLVASSDRTGSLLSLWSIANLLGSPSSDTTPVTEIYLPAPVFDGRIELQDGIVNIALHLRERFVPSIRVDYARPRKAGWSFEDGYFFYGYIVPMLLGSECEVFRIGGSTLVFTPDGQETSPYVLQSDDSIATLLKDLERPRSVLRSSKFALMPEPDMTKKDEYERYLNAFTWERETAKRDRWEDLKARGGHVDDAMIGKLQLFREW